VGSELGASGKSVGSRLGNVGYKVGLFTGPSVGTVVGEH